jgi:2-polyprenyl-3-methyl-5-hydroxy-6-metoxy-1,4-benzoquinol methylase
MVAVPLPARQRTQDDYVSLLRRHCRMAGNFLEIGPDIGLFTSSLAKTGSFNHLWLYEPNRNVHQSLSDGLRGLSHTINENFFRASDVPAESVSTTVMIHVLDHVLQPMDLLRQIRTSLEPGGIIFIVTHDCDSLLALLMGRRWPPYTLQHPQLFSRRSIATLLQLSGFEMIETVKTTNYFPASFLMQAALAVCGLSRAGVSGGAAPLVPVKLGNIAAIARKPA